MDLIELQLLSSFRVQVSNFLKPIWEETGHLALWSPSNKLPNVWVLGLHGNEDGACSGPCHTLVMPTLQMSWEPLTAGAGARRPRVKGRSICRNPIPLWNQRGLYTFDKVPKTFLLPTHICGAVALEMFTTVFTVGTFANVASSCVWSQDENMFSSTLFLYGEDFHKAFSQFVAPSNSLFKWIKKDFYLSWFMLLFKR